MIYFSNGALTIRSMMESDIEKFVVGFKEQGWHKSKEMFSQYFSQQEDNERSVVIAEIEGNVAGYITLISSANAGPFAKRNIPEIIDFNVLMKYQRRGIGSSMMDVVENLAKEKSNYVSLSVGLHAGYGSAQRMYVKRGYIPDGSGVWYGGRQAPPYTSCENDDDLTLYFSKQLKRDPE